MPEELSEGKPPEEVTPPKEKPQAPEMDDAQKVQIRLQRMDNLKDLIEEKGPEHCFGPIHDLVFSDLPEYPGADPGLLEEMKARRQEMRDMLEKTYEFRVIQPQPGERFDYRIHKAQQESITDERNKDGTIAEVLFPGCIQGKKVLVPAVVRVYRFEERPSQ